MRIRWIIYLIAIIFHIALADTNNDNRFMEIYRRVYMEYYAVEKYEDALSVLLRVDENELSVNSRLLLNLLLGRIYVNLGNSQKAEEKFINSLRLQSEYIPPAGEWLPNEEQAFFSVRTAFLASSRQDSVGILPKILEYAKQNILKIGAGATVVIAGVLLFSKKSQKSSDPLPEPPDFPQTK
ncbi:MAG: hypothetical protein Kow00108_13750 [Calditrichia bacterium]